MTVRYVFKGPPRITGSTGADSQAIGECMVNLAQRHGGKLQPQDVVDEARDEKHPIHRHFEWDDAIAAEAHRRDQARELINCVVVERGDDARREPLFVAINEGRGGTFHRLFAEVRTNPQLQWLLMEQATNDLIAWEKRYRELGDVCALVREAREKLIEQRRAAGVVEIQPSAPSAP